MVKLSPCSPNLRENISEKILDTHPEKYNTFAAMNKIDKLQLEAPKEIPLFVKASRLIKKIDGLSISLDEGTYEEIKKILSFKPATPEGRELKKNMLDKAYKKSREGMFGGGMFFID